ncbi:GTPase HflX [Nodosilinea sp. LEGE 07088]|uniref:GTPase HflX n=1 Tax=Nodosilinea sp. LEGE 07088 TaxID=2777968 RepID=UPI0034D972C0
METVYGHLKGLKPSQLKQLQRIYHQRLPGDCVVTPEFAQRLAAVSTEIDSPLCAYINRRGQVIRVGVGTLRQTQIPPTELPRYGAERLSGIRCITTQFELAPPGDATLTTMALQRLDVLAVLALSGTGFTRRGGGATGYIHSAYLAHLVPHPEQRWLVSAPTALEALSQQDFLALAEGLEAEFSRAYTARQVEDDRDRVLVVGLFTSDQTADHFHTRLQELDRLVDSAGGEVLETLYQKRPRPHPQTVLGAGKVQEVALAAQTVGANLIVFDRDLSPMQVRNLEKLVGIRVVDRTELILDIFAQRAKTGAGQLQVELAQLEYQMPRLRGRGQAMSRLGGGIGTRGPGETKLETERRTIQRRINKLQQEVNQLQAHRSRLRHRRQDDNLPSIAVVGYTNAGKSTLVNTLTNSEVYAADQLFATLDPTTRRLAITDPLTHATTQLVLTDTVGFIEELPASLMDAFRATLEEVTEADALLHVVDVSHPAWQDQIHWVMRILKQMPIVPGPMLLVFNKADRVSNEVLELAYDEYPQALFISATERLGLDTLRQRLLTLIDYAVTV